MWSKTPITDFVCLYNYEFGLSLCKIVRSSVILLLPLFSYFMFAWYYFSMFSKIFLRHTLTNKLLTLLTSLSLYIFTIWKCIAYNFFLQRRNIFQWSQKNYFDCLALASFLDLYLEFDDSGQLSTKIYDKRDDFNLSHDVISVKRHNTWPNVKLHTVFFYRLCEV
jgi:hypothetical protein